MNFSTQLDTKVSRIIYLTFFMNFCLFYGLSRTSSWKVYGVTWSAGPSPMFWVYKLQSCQLSFSIRFSPCSLWLSSDYLYVWMAWFLANSLILLEKPLLHSWGWTSKPLKWSASLLPSLPFSLNSYQAILGRNTTPPLPPMLLLSTPVSYIFISLRKVSLTLLPLRCLWDDELCWLQVGCWMHQHKLLQVEILLLELLQVLQILNEKTAVC